MKSLILSAILGVTVLASSAMANPFNTADDGFSKEVLIYNPNQGVDVGFDNICWGCISPNTGRARDGYVSPHYRSNGTHVDGYWRS